MWIHHHTAIVIFVGELDFEKSAKFVCVCVATGTGQKTCPYTVAEASDQHNVVATSVNLIYYMYNTCTVRHIKIKNRPSQD
jgi:hypothetical protein